MHIAEVYYKELNSKLGWMASSILQTDKIVLVVVILVLSLIYQRRQNGTHFPTGPWSYPFIGNYNLLQTRPHIRLAQLREKYGDVFSITLGRRRAVVVSSWEGISQGLREKAVKMSGRAPDLMCSMFTGYTPDGGICDDNLSMPFKIKKDLTLHSFDTLCCSPAVEEAINQEAEKLALFLLAQRKPCDLALVLESTMLRIMLFLINGTMYLATDENFQEIWQTFRMNFEIVASRWEKVVGFQLLRGANTYGIFQIRERTKLQYAYQRDIVNRHKDRFNPEIVADVVDHGLVMVEKNEDMGLLTQEELDSLFVELSACGYNQLSAVLLWLILYVSYFPHVQDKIYDELMLVVGKERLPKLSDQPSLVYMCAVILETHRLATVMPLLYPHVTTEDTPFMGYSIPKDTLMLFNVWSLHHDRKHWKHTMKFDPERFIEDGALHIPDHYLPYGDGVRSCPGEALADIQIFIFATFLLYHIRFTLTDQPDLEGLFKGFVLTPKPYKVSFTPRETVPYFDELQPTTNNATETKVCVLDDDNEGVDLL